MLSSPKKALAQLQELSENTSADIIIDEEDLELLHITGEIAIEPLSYNPDKHRSYVVVLIGPTGAGKSSFIESLSSSTQTLSLSKNQLAGYTQIVQAYEIINLRTKYTSRQGHPIYLVDTPGFSDSTISEKEIVDMIYDWMRINGLSRINSLLYFTPINAPRLSGSKHKTLTMFTQLLLSDMSNFNPAHRLRNLVFVTTMWDQLFDERTQGRGDARFAELRDVHFKDYITLHTATLTRFTNSRLSALQILNDSLIHFTTASPAKWERKSIWIYRDLNERIFNTLQQKRTIEDNLNLNLSMAQGDDSEALNAILVQWLKDTNATLAKFINQFTEFGPPKPPGVFDYEHTAMCDAIADEGRRPQHPCLRLALEQEGAEGVSLTGEVSEDEQPVNRVVTMRFSTLALHFPIAPLTPHVTLSES